MKGRSQLKILGIDTSTTAFSICIFEDNKVLYELRRERSFMNEQKDAGLFSAIQELLNNKENEIIDAIALSIGPGMFTSLRVGLALAKGLYFSRNIPLCGVNTLDVIAHSFFLFEVMNKEKNIICASVMEAFQGEVFVAFYNRKVKIGHDMVFNPNELTNFIERKFKNKKLIAIGPGVKILAEHKMKKNAKNNLYIIDSPLCYPSASKVISTALSKIKMGVFDDPENLEPYYIKKTSAEQRWKS